MGRSDDAEAPLVLWRTVSSDLVGLIIVSQSLHDLARLVQERDSPLDFADGDKVSMNGGASGKELSSGDFSEELPVERHVNHSHVGAIGSQDTWWGKTGIHHDLVEGAELVGGRKEPETTALGAIGIQDRPRVIHETIAGIAVTWHFLWFTTSHI